MVSILARLSELAQKIFKALFFRVIANKFGHRAILYMTGTKVARVFDGNGDSAIVGEYDNCLFPLVPGYAENLAEAQKFQARDDDLWIVNWPKSGTHWVFDLVCMLVNNKAELAKEAKEEAMYPEAVSLKTVNKLASPRILDTHVPVKYFPRSALENSKIIYTVRNPKDAFVSFYHHMKNIKMYYYQGTWDGFFRLAMDGKVEYGSWFDHTEEWMKEIEGRPNVLIVHYESLKKNFIQELKRIAEFIDYPRPELYDAIAEKATIQNMRKNKEQIGAIFKDKSGMFRKGIVGDWRNHFTLAQNQEIEEMIKARMPKIKLSLEYS